MASIARISNHSLDSNDHNEVYSMVESLQVRWAELGMKLGVSYYDEIEAIDDEKSTNSRKLMKMLSVWLRRGRKDQPIPSWRILHNAVETLDRNIADAIARNHSCSCHKCLETPTLTSLTAVRASVDEFAEVLQEEETWYQLGIFLGASTKELNAISDLKNHSACDILMLLIKLYECLEKEGKSLSWESIATALRRMNNNGLAEKIHSQYVKPSIEQERTTGNQAAHSSSSPLSTVSLTASTNNQTHLQHYSSSTTDEVVETSVPIIHTDHDPPIPIPQVQDEPMVVSQSSDEPHPFVLIKSTEHKPVSMIAKEYETLFMRFHAILLKVKRAVKNENIDLDEIQDELRRQCGLRKIPQEKSTLDAVFTRVEEQCSILNFLVLEFIVKNILNHGKTFMKQLTALKRSVERFKSSANMVELVTLIKSKQTTPSDGQKQVKLKVRESWNTFSYKQFETIINEIFGDHYNIMTNITVTKGCICYNWIIPDVDTTKLLPQLPLEFVRLIGVIHLHIGNEVIYNIEGDGCETIEAAMLQAIELKNTQAIELLLAVGCSPQVATYNDSNTVTNIVNIRAIESKESSSDGSSGACVDHKCIFGHNEYVEAIVDPSWEPDCSSCIVKDKINKELHQEIASKHDEATIHMQTIQELASELEGKKVKFGEAEKMKLKGNINLNVGDIESKKSSSDDSSSGVDHVEAIINHSREPAAECSSCIAKEKIIKQLRLENSRLRKNAATMPMEKKIEEYSMGTDYKTISILVRRGIWRLLNSSMENKWNKLEAEMIENGIKVLYKSKPSASKPYLKIKGDRNMVKKIKEKFMELQKSVYELKFTVARPGVVQHFYKDPHGISSLTGVESAAKVCIELEVQQEDDSETEPTTPTGKGSSFKKVCTANIHGSSVNLYVGDITKFNRAEVIVNVANEDLLHSMGVAGAIVDRGGPVITKDSQDYVNRKGKVPTGSAVIFHRVGNLPPPYQAIVHAVGPRWSSYGGSDSKDRNSALLRKTVRNSLQQARSFNSIAIPASSSGVFGFPIDIAANSLVQGVVEFMTNNSDYNLNDINFVIFDDNVAAFKKAIKEYLQNVHMFDEVPQPSAVTKSTPTASQLPPQMNLRSRKRASSNMDTSISTASAEALTSKGSSKVSVLNRIKITKDDILKHQCEVLVNTTDQQLGFGGFVGRVLLKAAGSGLQDECKSISKPIQYGNIVTTKAHQLKSKHIVHVVLPKYSGSDSGTELRGVINKCLQECTRLNAKSISIPSIGAGNLGYPSDVVAMCLLEEAFRYLSDNDGQTSLQLIHFVIFDATVHQAFQQYYSQMPTSRTDIDVSDNTCRNSVDEIRKTSSLPPKNKFFKKPTGRSVHSSRPSDVNSCSFALDNGIHLHLIQGDITDERADVIVNTTNPELILAQGGVSSALLNKGGPGLQDACNQIIASNIKATEGKVVETRCEGIGQLRCKSIFHIVFKGKDQQKLVKTILACLERAEKMQYKSIAIPAIGTGSVKYSSILAAEAIVKALKQFRKANYVKEVRMVIFMPHMFEEFMDAFEKIEEESSGPEGSHIFNYIRDKGNQFLDKMPSLGQIIDSEKTCTTHDEENTNNHLDSEGNEESEDFEHIGGMPMDEDVLSSISLDAAVTTYIFGESEQAVKRAEKKLKSMIDTLIVNEEVVDQNICELSSTALSDLKQFANKQNVDIDIDNDPVLYSIKLHGCTNDVLKVKDKVRDALSYVHQLKAKKEVASTVSKHFKWVRQLSDGPEDYNEVFSFEIEQAFQKNKPIYYHNGDNEQFTIDFSTMEETDLDNGEKVKVFRIDFAEAYEKPHDWVSMPTNSNGIEVTVHLVTLKQSDAEYKKALSKFDATMKSSYTQIVSIQRIQNPVLYGQYMARKKEMEKRNPSNCQNERWLFHGTKPAVIDAINTQGYNRSFKNVTAYGQGVYFARDASYSHRYAQPDPSNQHRHMYLTQVLTGEFTLGNHAMLVPPAKNNQQNQHILFDSTVNNTADPAIFVVYTDSQAYAAYLITYQ